MVTQDANSAEGSIGALSEFMGGVLPFRDQREEIEIDCGTEYCRALVGIDRVPHELRIWFVEIGFCFH